MVLRLETAVMAFGNWTNGKIAIIALLGMTAGQAVIWYSGQFYARLFLVNTLKVPANTADEALIIALLIATGGFIFFGWLSDKIGRLKIILAGCLIASLTYFPLFGALTHYVNPALEAAQNKTPITMAASECNFHIFVGPWSKFTDCDKAKDFLTKSGISFTSTDLPAGSTDRRGVISAIVSL